MKKPSSRIHDYGSDDTKKAIILYEMVPIIPDTVI